MVVGGIIFKTINMNFRFESQNDAESKDKKAKCFLYLLYAVMTWGREGRANQRIGKCSSHGLLQPFLNLFACG